MQGRAGKHATDDADKAMGEWDRRVWCRAEGDWQFRTVMDAQASAQTRQICGLRIEHAQGAGVDRIASWRRRLVDVLIRRAVMEGILRQGPRLYRPPAAEAGPLQVGWTSCGCRAGPRIHAGKHIGESGKRGDGVDRLRGCGIWALVWALGFCSAYGCSCGCVGVVSDVAAAVHLCCACERVVAVVVV